MLRYVDRLGSHIVGETHLSLTCAVEVVLHMQLGNPQVRIKRDDVSSPMSSSLCPFVCDYMPEGQSPFPNPVCLLTFYSLLTFSLDTSSSVSVSLITTLTHASSLVGNLVSWTCRHFRHTYSKDPVSPIICVSLYSATSKN